MQRRKFLALTGITLTSALTLPNLSYLLSSSKEAGIGIILNEFHYLNLNKKGVAQFVEEYFIYEADLPFLQTKIKSYYLFRIRAQESHLVERLTSLYLFSSDFFLNGMDEKREINYVSFYNPYKTPCRNPFSSAYYPRST